MLSREGKQQTCVSESPLPKCFGAKLCILVSVIQMQLLAIISKGGFKNIFA